MASIALGEGPNTFSLAPIRALNLRPIARSCASGPTNGTLAGSASTWAVVLGVLLIINFSL